MGEQVGRRVVIALGGNAIAPAGTGGTAPEQTANIARAMALVADLVAQGHQVVITHGNGPQVGNLLVKNELARAIVPPMPLDWCVAQTQATIGFTMCTELERELAARDLPLPVIPIISRVLVAADDPAFDAPSKPVGRYVAEEVEVRRRQEETGQAWARQGDRGWRRVVASPEPIELLDGMSARLVLSAGAVLVANGGGGIPMVRQDGRLVGVEAVVDKDLAAVLLAQTVEAEELIILTDVEGVAVGFGTPEERWLEDVCLSDMRAYQAEGQFSAGSMGPKVEAACRFVERGGTASVIGSLEDASRVLSGEVGTRVVADRG